MKSATRKRDVCQQLLRQLEREAGHLAYPELDRLGNKLMSLADRIRRGQFADHPGSVHRRRKRT